MPLAAVDLAAQLLAQLGPTFAWKLQKRLYYVQAEHLVLYGVPLFPDRIEASADGLSCDRCTGCIGSSLK